MAALAVGCRPVPSPEEGAPRTGADATAEVKTEHRDASADPSEGEASHSGEASRSPADPRPPADPPAPDPDPLAASGADSTSIGSCTTGRLDRSLALPLRAPGLLFHPNKDPGSRFGTVELVQGLVRAAAAVERVHPGVPVTVGDLARETGGELSGHASHRSGRDVDVLFYLQREDGEAFVPAKAIPLDPAGRGTDYGDLADPSDDVPVMLDLARTWSFVAALLADEAVAVQRIFIVEHLRTRLLEQAERVDAPADVMERFAEVTCQPSFPHDDHMHIRVFCSPEDVAAGCLDGPPMYPWRKRALATAGVEPVLVGQGDDETSRSAAPRKPKPKLKTIEQARAEAGPMHEDVVAFLDRRNAWVKKPHPGRRWCR